VALNFSCAPLVAMQAVLLVMRARGAGAIINVSSGSLRTVLPGVEAYAATKAALSMLSLVAREEFAPDGIVDSLVYPSVTATEFHDNVRAAVMGPGGGGLTPHSPRYVAKAIVRAIRTGEADIVIPAVLSAQRRWRSSTRRDERAKSTNAYITRLLAIAVSRLAAADPAQPYRVAAPMPTAPLVGPGGEQDSTPQQGL
jgi:short-subunit dehydrogenase